MSADTFNNLATLVKYLDLQCARLTALVKEIEEVQREFETSFVRTQQHFENTRAAVFAWADDHDWQLPAWLAQAVNQRLPAVHQEKTARLAEVRQELTELEDQREAIEQQDEAGVETLRQQNPRLNNREEELKISVERTQAALQEKLDQWRRAGSGIGWLTRPGEVRRLRGETEKLAKQLSRANTKLTEVRNTWHTLETKTSETEATLQEAWRLRTAEIARLKRELNALQADFETVCREAALTEALDALAAPQDTTDPDLDRLLAQLIALRDESRSYETGIAQVAELMGILKGLCEGLTRMRESVAAVKSEQDMHAELSNLRLKAPPNVLEFHSLWDHLSPVVLDEKQAVQHPREFATHLEQVIGDRLSNSDIENMFTSLGNELKRATKEQWK